jgi:hypothetical protein
MAALLYFIVKSCTRGTVPLAVPFAMGHRVGPRSDDSRTLRVLAWLGVAVQRRPRKGNPWKTPARAHFVILNDPELRRRRPDMTSSATSAHPGVLSG